MSKKHFNDLAARLYRLKPKENEECQLTAELLIQWQKMVKEMADFCAEHNSNFKRGQFLTACGVN